VITPLGLATLGLAQAVSSYLSNATLHAAIDKHTFKFIVTASISDAFKLTIYASVAIVAVRGSWLGVVVVAVLGGAVGNYLAHRKRFKDNQ